MQIEKLSTSQARRVAPGFFLRSTRWQTGRPWWDVRMFLGTSLCGCQAFAPMSLPSSLPSSLPNIPSFSSFPSSHWPFDSQYSQQSTSRVCIRFQHSSAESSCVFMGMQACIETMEMFDRCQVDSSVHGPDAFPFAGASSTSLNAVFAAWGFFRCGVGDMTCII